MSEELKPVFEITSRVVYNENPRTIVYNSFIDNHKHSSHTNGLILPDDDFISSHSRFLKWIRKQMEFAYDMGRKAKPTFTKEDAEKALEALFKADTESQGEMEGKDVVQVILDAIGEIKE